MTVSERYRVVDAEGPFFQELFRGHILLQHTQTSRRVRYWPTFWFISCVCTQREPHFIGENGSPKPGHHFSKMQPFQGFCPENGTVFSRVFEFLLESFQNAANIFLFHIQSKRSCCAVCVSIFWVPIGSDLPSPLKGSTIPPQGWEIAELVEIAQNVGR